MHQLHTFFQQWFEQQQLPAELSIAALLLLVLLLGGLLDLLIRKVLLRWIHTNVHSNTMEWDDVLWKYKVFQRGVHLFPGILLYYTVSRFLSDTPLLQDFLIKLTTAYLVIMGGLAFLAIINAMTHLADLKNNNDKLPLRVLQQSFKLMVALAIVVTLFSLLLDQNPLYLLSGLGAFTAIILLIFKDTLLGLVAGVQLAANDMVRRKDWIEMSKYDADGDVVDVGLTTVKVRNWDKTITTIPTYALITDSFKNWRGMTESGGRRIKRSVLIDVTSIAFMTDELNAALAEVTILTPYLAAKNQQLAEQPEQLLKASLVNGRRLTNIGTFRTYL